MKVLVTILMAVMIQACGAIITTADRLTADSNQIASNADKVKKDTQKDPNATDANAVDSNVADSNNQSANTNKIVGTSSSSSTTTSTTTTTTSTSTSSSSSKSSSSQAQPTVIIVVVPQYLVGSWISKCDGGIRYKNTFAADGVQTLITYVYKDADCLVLGEQFIQQRAYSADEAPEYNNGVITFGANQDPSTQAPWLQGEYRRAPSSTVIIQQQ